MKTKTFAVGFVLSLSLWGAEAGATWYLPGEKRPNDLWPQRMREACALVEAAVVPGGPAAETLAETGPLAKHIPPTPLSVDVTGLAHVWLLSLDGGDGDGGDHCTWVDPILTDTDGTRENALARPILASDSGWRSFEIANGETSRQSGRHHDKFRVAGKEYRNAWWNHPTGAFCLQLDGRYTRLDVGVGAEAGSSDWGKLGFAVVTALPRARLARMLGENLGAEFPQIDKWLAQDLGVASNGHVRLFRQSPEKLRECLARYGAPGVLDRLACRETLEDVRRAVDFVAAARAIPEQVAQFAALEKEYDAATQGWTDIQNRLVALRRDVILKHPKLDFADLLVNKQPTTHLSHQCDQYLGRHSRAGAGLVILRDWKNAHPREEVLLKDKLPAGSVAHPDLSFDARKIAFAFCDCTERDERRKRFCLWEIGVDGSGLRPLTGGAADVRERWDGRETALVEDFDPCYLPDGGLAFISTRCQTFGRCHAGRYVPSYMLYRMNGDGTGIRQLSFGEANEWDPSVLPDGRIIYTRWDYINRNDVVYQSLWTIHPDGTGTAHYYGNYTVNPCMTAEARAISGTDHVVSTAMAHHGLTAGSLIEIDPVKGSDGPEPITRLTPEVAFPETESPTGPGAYQTPWPLGDGFYLASYSRSKTAPVDHHFEPNDFGIVLLDPLGGRTEIYRDETVSTVSPIPLVPRPRPPMLASSLPQVPRDTPGKIVVQNANLGQMSFGEPIRAIRVNEIYGQPTAHVPHRGAVAQEIVKRVLGTAEVAADGSTAFEIPSGRPLQLQALGTNGIAVMTMRSFIYAQPGETLACLGCHENKAQAPQGSYAAQACVQKLRPLAGQNPTGGFDYQATVQPVWDRHCVKCHGGDEPKAGLDLRGGAEDRGGLDYPPRPELIRVPRSYNRLVDRAGLVKLAVRNRETTSSKPRDYFAASGKLAPFLLGGHCKSLLADADGLACVLAWLDLNAQCFGDYSWSRPIDGGDGRPPANGTCGLKPCRCGCCWVPAVEKR